MKKTLSYLIIFGFLLSIVVAYTAYTKLFSKAVFQKETIYITKTDKYLDLKAKLDDKNLIKDEKVFDLLAKKMNLENNVHAGKFILSEGSSIIDIIRKLRGNQQDAVNLVINNVNFKQDLAGKISNQLNIDSLTFLNFLNNESKLKEKGYNKDNIMCQFVPNTYEMYWSPSLGKLIKRFEKEHNTFWNEQRTDLAKKKGLSTDEAFILASIVEKEYKFASERKRIAGVYLNRLNIGMPLQADPTCKFAWGDLSLKRVLNIHTQNPHSYNTYYIKGLPPGPICLPETSTIDDVLNAESHNYIYFCAHADLDGKHEFNKTLSAHNAAARKYQAALNKLKIYK